MCSASSLLRRLCDGEVVVVDATTRGFAAGTSSEPVHEIADSEETEGGSVMLGSGSWACRVDKKVGG